MYTNSSSESFNRPCTSPSTNIGYLPLKKAGFTCQLFKKEHLVLVTSASNTQFLSGIRKEDLVNINFLMCNFALQDVGQFIRGLFPKYYQFALEIDDCSTVIPFLLDQNNYSFLPKQIVEPYIEKGTLREIPLLDFDTPIINSYVIANLKKKEVWEELWNMLKSN